MSTRNGTRNYTPTCNYTRKMMSTRNGTRNYTPLVIILQLILKGAFDVWFPPQKAHVPDSTSKILVFQTSMPQSQAVENFLKCRS